MTHEHRKGKRRGEEAKLEVLKLRIGSEETDSIFTPGQATGNYFRRKGEFGLEKS